MASDVEARLQEKINRSVKAEAIKREPLFIEAVESMKDDLWTTLCTIDPKDAQGLLILRLKASVLNDFTGHFSRAIDDGKIAKSQLQQIKDRLAKAVKPVSDRFRRHRG